MGNQSLVPSQIQNVESYFYELRNLFKFKASLGSTTFVKTARVVFIDTLTNLNGLTLITNEHLLNSINSNQQQQQQLQHSDVLVQLLKELQQLLVVKIFPKYDLSIRHDLYAQRIQEIKNLIYQRYGQCTNCLPFNKLIITDKAAFVFRQFIKYNLYDRLSTHPFLNDIEKKWLVFQLMSAVNECHSLKIIHGDIKTENVLVNSFLWVSLSDFASYKPVYLSSNHPSADFNYYFDTSRRRTCYLAPERFDTPKQKQHSQYQNNSQQISDNEYKPPNQDDFTFEMDIFSLGCTIAEVFLERPLFDFARLLAYREGKYDPSNEFNNEITDKSIVQMILSMISLDSSKRKTIDVYLQEQNDNNSFPSYFVYLKRYLSKFLNNQLLPDDIIIQLKSDLPCLLKNLNLNVDFKVKTQSTTTNHAFLILLSLLLTSIRKLKYAKTKLIAIELMLKFSKFLQDSIILDRILPYFIYLLESKQLPIVKASVIYALNNCLDSIKEIDSQNVNIFHEIVFDVLVALSKDDSYLVRATVARTISSFAHISVKFLDSKLIDDRSLKYFDQQTPVNSSLSPRKLTEENTYDKKFVLNQTKVIEIIMNLLNDVSYVSSNSIREALLRSNFDKLCSFFGRQKTSEFLLPHMITILNEKTDWLVRAAFFDALTVVLASIGWESVDLVKSLLEQGLKDSEEFVIHRTLNALSNMVQIGLFDRQQIVFLLHGHVAALLCHPSLWIRHGAVNFISSICKQTQSTYESELQMLNKADILCTIVPTIDKYLKFNDLIEYDRPEILFNCLKEPLKRCIYDYVAQEGRSDYLFSYLNERSEIRSLANENFRPGYVDCSDIGIQQLFDKLRSLGLSEDDEEKLLSMKEFMDRTRMSRLSSSLHGVESMNSNISMPIQYFKDSYYLKDGCISIIKDRFSYLESVNLNHRANAAGSSDGRLNQNEVNTDDTSRKVNAEWKVMFSSSSASASNQSLDRNRDSLSNQSFRKRNQTFSSNKQNHQQQQRNCLIEFEDYLNKCKIQHEENKQRQERDVKTSETINSSINSNIICLSSNATTWKPKGHLLVHSNEHTKSINKMCKNSDSTYFATCSTDEQIVKLWSTESLFNGNAGFFKSKLTYTRFDSENQSSRYPTHVTFSDNNSLIVLCDDFRLYKINFDSDKRQFQIYSDDKLFQSGLNLPQSTSFYQFSTKNQVSNEASTQLPNAYPTELIYINDSGPVLNDYHTGSPVNGLFCYSSSTGYISCVDMRTRIKAFDLKCDLRKGYVTSMITNPWNTLLAAGTSHGFIDVFDFRFMIPIEEFSHRSKASVVKLANHPTLKSHLIASYRGNNEVAIWNLNSNSRSQNMVLSRSSKSPEFTFWGVNSPPLCAQMSIETSNKFISGIYGINTNVTSNAGYLICASTDMKIRCIDLNDTNSLNSYIVSSPTNISMQVHQKSNKDYTQTFQANAPVHYETRQIEGSKVLVEIETTNGQQFNFNMQNTYSSNTSSTQQSLSYNSHALAFQSVSSHHHDSITDLLMIYKNSSNQPFLVTSSRDGNLKIYQTSLYNSIFSRRLVPCRNNIQLTINIQNRNFAWNSFGFIAKAQEAKKVDEIKAPSTTNADIDEYTGYIPDPPSIPVDDVVLSSLGEPTLHSLGLGNYYTPVGWIQNSIEFLHTNLDLPWFGAISLTCFLIRILMIRVTIQIQKNAARMKVIGADMKEIQDKITDAKIKGNKLEEHMLTYKLVEFMKQHGYSIGGQMMPMLAQGIAFTSGFWGVKSMCNLPVDSMRQGGISWFTDLTLTDPYFILPLMSIFTLVNNLEKGLELGAGTDTMSHSAKWVMRACMVPLLYYFSFHAPAGLMCYVVTSNICTVGISRITRLDAVRKRYDIPTISEEKEQMLKERKNTQGFLEGFRDSLNKMKQMKETEDRERLRAEILKRAGSKIVKTYKENPQLKAKTSSGENK